MHQIVSATVDSSRRWWVLAIVVAAQFMFGVDAFIVNVAIPTIAVELHASSAQIEAVIAIYLIAYATLVITGGRLGDIYGTRNVFLAGVLGFTLTSLWCGLAQTGPELILARPGRGWCRRCSPPFICCFPIRRVAGPLAFTAWCLALRARPAFCSAACW